MLNWYVLQVLSSHEKKVKRSLEELVRQNDLQDSVSDIIVPIENVSEIKMGKQRVVEKRVWPGYILVKADLSDRELWHKIRNVDGVIAFLGGADPNPLSQEEVDEILQDLREKGDKITHKHQFEVGDNVKIVDGVFVNFAGTVTDVFHDKGRLSVLVSIFGRETRVDDLEFWQVEMLNEEVDV